jgi:hypothetical protein
MYGIELSTWIPDGTAPTTENHRSPDRDLAASSLSESRAGKCCARSCR